MNKISLKKINPIQKPHKKYIFVSYRNRQRFEFCKMFAFGVPYISSLCKIHLSSQVIFKYDVYQKMNISNILGRARQFCALRQSLHSRSSFKKYLHSRSIFKFALALKSEYIYIFFRSFLNKILLFSSLKMMCVVEQKLFYKNGKNYFLG